MSLHITILFVILFCLSSGCSSLLPVARRIDESRWENFDQIKSSFDLIIPSQTNRTDLHQLGFDPYQTPNMQIHNYLTIIAKFMPNTNITLADLPSGLRICVESKNSCVAYELKVENLKSQRHGNLFLDLLRFKRQSTQTGWRFSVFIVLVDDLVVYKLWDGQPRLEGEIYKKNPLGPLQDPAELGKDAAVFGIF